MHTRHATLLQLVQLLLLLHTSSPNGYQDGHARFVQLRGSMLTLIIDTAAAAAAVA